MENRRIIYVTKSKSCSSFGIKPSIVLSSVEELMKELLSDGDIILFEGGHTYEGMLHISDRKMVTIGSTGIGSVLIKAGNGDGICLSGCSGCEIYGLRIGGAGWRYNCNGTGISLKACDDIIVRNTEVFGFRNSGIEMDSCCDIIVTGCYAHSNGYCGIGTCMGAAANRNIRITHCKALDNAGNPDITGNHSGNGIVIFHADGVLVEYCEAAGNGWAQRQKNMNGPVGIWCACDSKNVVFRKCISHNNRTQPGCVDGDGLDIDGAVINGYMEYNYSYDNEGSGYLFCEYGSGMEWSNNNMRYCVSINDGLRVQRQGSVQFYGPDWIKLDGSQIAQCLFVPAEGHHCIVNNEIGKECTGLSVSDCVLVEGTVSAVKDPENPYISVVNNHLIKDKKIYQSIIQNVPRLTDPRSLDELPVFKQLEHSSCWDAVNNYSMNELFNTALHKEIPDKFKMFTYYLNGEDFEGSDCCGEAKLVYDSIQAGYALRMSGAASFIKFHYPSWNEKAKHMAILRARLESPDVEAYLYISKNDRMIRVVNITGSVSDYHDTVLEFEGFEGIPFIGVIIKGHSGSVLLQKIDIYEFSKEKEGLYYQERQPELDKTYLMQQKEPGRDYLNTRSALNGFISFGDVYEKEDNIYLNGKGSSIFRYAMVPDKSVSMEAEITAEAEGGYLFIETGGIAEIVRIEKGSRHYRVGYSCRNDFIKYGVINNIVVNNDTKGNASVGNVTKGNVIKENELIKITKISLLEEVM